MSEHLYLDGPNGVLAIWTGATDLGPATSPGSYPTRVRFHSSRDILGFLATPVTGTATVTNWSGTTAASMQRTLFAHGLGYRPLLLGWLTVDGTNVPIQGSALQRHGSDYSSDMAFTVGADSTYVYLNQLRFRQSYATQNARTIGYTIYLGTYGLTSGGAIRRPTAFNGVEVSSSEVTAGRFSTLYRYPYRNSSAGNARVPNGATISAGIGWTDLYIGLGYRYSCNGHVVERNASATSNGAYQGNNASFNASLTRLAL